MKNQYFGDINDYKKYGLLRVLSNHGEITTAVCWMLTPDDNRTDGNLIGYLNRPEKWRAFDPPLFDALADHLRRLAERTVKLAETADILPATRFYSAILTDDAAERRQYFARFFAGLPDCNLIFFDPDNGLEVRSKPYGKKDSNKYLYRDEVREAYRRGSSLLIYQHFSRQARRPFINHLVKQLFEITSAPEIITFSTGQTVFLLLPQPRHLKYFRARSEAIAAGPQSVFEVITHSTAKPYLNRIDFDTPGPRCDVTPLFADYAAFSALLDDIEGAFARVNFDCVAGIDALGFILGAALALRMRKGFIPIRKGGKLPVPADRVSFVDYTGSEKSLELRSDALKVGTRVLVVDEWIETGAQVNAAIRLIEGQGGVVAGIATINLDDNPATRRLRETYRCYSANTDEQ